MMSLENKFILWGLIGAGIGLVFGLYLIFWVLAKPAGNEKMQEIARAIQEGAVAYLKRQYLIIAVIAVVLAVILGLKLAWLTALGFLLGAVFSALSGAVGMMIATRANVRCAEAARTGQRAAFAVAAKSGQVTGFLVAGLALLSVTGFYALTHNLSALIGLGFGGSLISIFARLGGGIFTKAADVGADLVGKVEAGIPEDDPRNPAVIADNVGDNVGDDAGMAADLFETYAVTAIAAMILGSLTFPGSTEAVLLPLLIGGVAIFASIIGTFFVRLRKDSKKIMRALYKGLAASSVLTLAGLWYFLKKYVGTLGELGTTEIFNSLPPGIAVTVLIVIITEYYTSTKFRPVKSIANSSTTGHGTNVITGLSVGMEATALPVIVIIAG